MLHKGLLDFFKTFHIISKIPTKGETSHFWKFALNNMELVYI